MDERTTRHLLTALENQHFAAAFVVTSEATPAQLRWAAVAAFYAAVHYVNAYLWKLARLNPADHRSRRTIMDRWPPLTALLSPYERLSDAAFKARYEPGGRITNSRTFGLVTRDLVAVEVGIRAELNKVS